MSRRDRGTSMSGGISFGGALTLVFIVLKLTHNINWSWLWVLSPLWLSFCLNVLLLILFVIVDSL